MKAENQISMKFNEKNPLNFINPITVNLYFKSSQPPVGYYDVYDSKP